MRVRAVKRARPAPAKSDRPAVRTWLRLLACSSMVEREVRRRLREEFDTTLPRFDVLAQLDLAARDGVAGLTMSELSRRLMVTNGNLTSLVDRLARERLVSRVSPPGDRRMQIVRLTALGQRSIDRMTAAHAQWVEELMAPIGEPAGRTLYLQLGELRDALRATIPPGSRS